MHWLAIDIGGANIKLADGCGFAVSRPFAMWRHHQGLAHELRTLVAEAPPSDHLAVTMTGELADCFESRADGVEFILTAVSEAADRRHTRVFLTNGSMVTPELAMHSPALAAASNWLALAKFCGRFSRHGPAVVIDLGSTTCDLVPLRDGQPAPTGRTDLERCLAGELVYTGVERSPVCALVQRIDYRGKSCPVAQELFATTGDVYVTLGDLAEDPLNQSTADHRPATKSAARVRLGRMIGADGGEFLESDALDFSRRVAAAQRDLIKTALRQVTASLGGPLHVVVLSGHGEFLLREVLSDLPKSAWVISLESEIGREASRCATAHALAVLAREATGL